MVKCEYITKKGKYCGNKAEIFDRGLFLCKNHTKIKYVKSSNMISNKFYNINSYIDSKYITIYYSIRFSIEIIVWYPMIRYSHDIISTEYSIYDVKYHENIMKISLVYSKYFRLSDLIEIIPKCKEKVKELMIKEFLVNKMYDLHFLFN